MSLMQAERSSLVQQHHEQSARTESGALREGWFQNDLYTDDADPGLHNFRYDCTSTDSVQSAGPSIQGALMHCRFYRYTNVMQQLCADPSSPCSCVIHQAQVSLESSASQVLRHEAWHAKALHVRLFAAHNTRFRVLSNLHGVCMIPHVFNVSCHMAYIHP